MSTQAVPYPELTRTPVERRFRYDPWLIAAVAALVALGLVMVASASISIAQQSSAPDLYFFSRQCMAVGLGLACGVVLVFVPLRMLEAASTPLLFLGCALLAAVWVPGLGHEVNGAVRWLKLGPLSLQPSEPVKLAVIVYISAYLVRHQTHVQTDFIGFIKPIGVVTVVAGLLLLEPDFGAAAVIFCTALGMLFLGGVPLVRFFSWGLASLSALATLAVQESYRMERLISFTDPWADPYRSGFQLTQALIAFGRGEWFGVGLGSSVQKLFYLPEVHTDFIFAMLAEELGLFGSMTVIGLFTFIVWRIFYIGGMAESMGQLFGARLAYGIGLLIGLAAFISMGVNMGLLPTKGLTLPFMSYGSNSMLVSCVCIALVLRVGVEVQQALERREPGA